MVEKYHRISEVASVSLHLFIILSMFWLVIGFCSLEIGMVRQKTLPIYVLKTYQLCAFLLVFFFLLDFL